MQKCEIAIVGDFHYDEKVSSRTDVYWKTCLEKLSEIGSKHKYIIFLGDFFNRPASISFEVGVELLVLLRRLKEDGVQVYTIIGNHDVFNDREDTLDRTSLGWFDSKGLITVLKPSERLAIRLSDDCEYIFSSLFIDYKQSFEFLRQCSFPVTQGIKYVFLAHNYFECQYDGFHLDDLADVNVDYIFFGHEHSPLTTHYETKSGVQILRPGAITRNAANDYNLKRQPFYYVLTSNGCFVESLDCAKPANEVFKKESFERTNLQLSRFSDNIQRITNQNLDAVIEKYQNTTNGNSITIKDALVELRAPSKVMEKVKAKYELIGEEF